MLEEEEAKIQKAMSDLHNPHQDHGDHYHSIMESLAAMPVNKRQRNISPPNSVELVGTPSPASILTTMETGGED
jgi:hypothetical protein